MNPKLLYRLASGLLLVFATGHTMGLFSSKDLPTNALPVRSAMFSTHFELAGADCTWGRLYVGFGLFVTLYLAFTAVLAWILGDLSRTNPGPELRALAWAFFGCQVGTIVLGYEYFFLPPIVFATVISVCLALAAWKLKAAGETPSLSSSSDARGDPPRRP